MRRIIWKIIYFWKFDVKCTIVGMFVMKWLHTAVWGGHNYALVADVIVRKMIIIIIITDAGLSAAHVINISCRCDVVNS